MKKITTVNGEQYTIKDTDRFVSMTDKLMSGWGYAAGKIAKRVIICDNLQQARAMEYRLRRPKHQMNHVNICFNIPRYSGKKYTVSYELYADNLFNF